MSGFLRVFAFALLLLLAACRQSAQPTPTPELLTPTPEIEIEMAVEPSPPATGDAVLLVRLHHPDGTPIENARIAVRGDMNHGGMVPVLGEAAEASDGIYRVPFEWTMGGDWIVTLTVTLEDGRQVERRFDMRISS
jgi:hypothetical protein